MKENITNGVAEALRLRIARAYRHGQTFRVIIVMPLLPSFPAGEFTFISIIIDRRYNYLPKIASYNGREGSYYNFGLRMSNMGYGLLPTCDEK